MEVFFIMMGSTHKMIGVFVGIVLAVCGILDKEYTMFVMPFVVPVGAMLPDIDHNNTRIGRRRKEVMGSLKKFLPIALIGFVLVIVYSIRQGIEISQLFPVICIVIGFLLLLLIGRSEWGRRKFRFFMKHRGIMHTLFVPALLIFATAALEVDVTVRQILLGIAIGYLTHLIADCLTEEGCPILWPLTTKCIGIPLAVTNRKSEKVIAVLLCGVFAVSLPVLYKIMR